MSEQWKPVVGYEGLYEVSDHGRVRSLDRVNTGKDGRTRKFAGRIVGTSLDENGRPRAVLRRDGKAVVRRVHRLVLEAFVGLPAPGEQACHWDDNPANNRLDNLRWGTRSDNALDSVRNGTHNMARKTECPQGHQYSEENTHTAANGRRTCRICSRAKTARWRARNSL